MKRLVAAPLWFLVGWYVGSAAAWAFGLGAFVAPILATGLAALIVVDPRRMIWEREAPVGGRAVAPASSATDPHRV